MRLLLFLGLLAATPHQGTESLVQAIHHLAKKKIEQPGSIRQAVNISLAELENDLDKLVEHAENDTQIITSVRSPSSEDIRKLFLYSYQGKNIDW